MLGNPKFLTTVLLLNVLPLAGCSTPQPDPAKTNLQLLVQYYNQYAGEHQGKPPPNEEAFKQYLAAKKIADSDKLFISPRDNQPYKITYGGPSSTNQPAGPLVPPDQSANQVIVAEEQTGVGGKRLVAYNSGVVKEVP